VIAKLVAIMENDGVYSAENERDYKRGDRRERSWRRRERKPKERIRRERDRPERLDVAPEDNECSPGMRTPIIIAKKNGTEPRKRESPTIVAIQRRGPTDHTGAASGGPAKGLYTESVTSYQKHNRYEKSTDPSPPSVPPTPPQPLTPNVEHAVTGLAALQLPSEVFPAESISLIDSAFQWSDKAFETLLDQNDFVVVGCVGMQAAGKSTLMSMISGQPIDSIEKTRLVFRPQKRSDLEKCIHRTVGVDMYITPGRLILLDTQPLLSPSMLDQYLRYDRKVPSEYSTAEICLEIQALQILTFLYTVCHVVLVVQDHFTDLNLLNLLKTAEMLKPSTVSHAAQDGSGTNPEDYTEYFPYIVFAYTCCGPHMFELHVLHSICEMTCKLFENSRLRIRNSASILRGPLMACSQLSDTLDAYKDLNLFILPPIQSALQMEDDKSSSVRGYRGHASLAVLVRQLRHQLAAMPRELFTHHVLSERNWFHYAARTWEAVKKSNLIAEYHRLLT